MRSTGVWLLFVGLGCSLLASDPIPARRAAENPFQVARWIAPPAVEAEEAACPLLRREFVLPGRPRGAILRIVGLGDYAAYLNGQPLTPTGISQPWSQYERSLYYRDFDVAPLLRRGTNAVGVMLFHSFWHNPNPPQGRYNKDGPQRAAPEPFLLRAELILRDDQGDLPRLGTDSSWRAAEGPIRFSHIFAGEDFDARRERPGWTDARFDDTGWFAAREVQAVPGELLPQSWPGIATREPRRPVSAVEVAPGVVLCSFPENLAAQLRVQLEGGRSGARVRFRCGEHRDPRNRLFGAYVVDCNLVTDGSRLTHQWHSFYLGMQFVEVTGAALPGAPNPQGLPVLRQIELVEVRADLPGTGRFRTSSDLHNGIHGLIDAAMRANMNWVLTDCPHREKLGWLECAYLLAPSFQYRYDTREWHRKILRDIRDAQEPGGRVPTVAPNYPAGRFPGAFSWTVEWGAAAVLLPWAHYQWNGDPGVLRENLDMMRRFTDHVRAEATDGLAPGGLGDWYDYGHGHPPGPSRFTPTTLSATATWALCARTVAQAADVLGLPAVADEYRRLHDQIAADFRRNFQDPITRRLRHQGSPQCANAMALEAGVVPPADHDLLVEDIIADLKARDWQQTAGDIGHVYFIRALAGAGRSDVLHRVYSRRGTGSYGGILAKGLTSMPETWDAMMDGYQSLNHCMLGHAMEWLYSHVAGIRQAPGSAGWQEALIAPNPGPLTRAEASVRTPRGEIAVRWRSDRGEFRLEAEIPDGLQATAILPSGRRRALEPGRRAVLRESMPPAH